MIIDLVSPWSAAVESTASTRSEFKARHAGVLEPIRAERAPLSDQLPLCDHPATLRRLALRASDATWQQQLRDDLARLAALGIEGCTRIVILAGDGTGDCEEAIPAIAGIALFLETAPTEQEMRIGLAVAVTRLARWQALASAAAATSSDSLPARWQSARDSSLREWVYATGLGLHAAATLFPTLPPNELLRMSPGAHRRLRERDKALQGMLARDLDQSGLGLMLRWTVPAAPATMRRAGGDIVPPGAGHYLAWKMVSPRVTRIGLGAALTLPA